MSSRPRRALKWAALPIGLVAAIALSGCTQQELQGWLPGGPDVTNHTASVIALWVNSWIVLLVVGVIVWGLIIWAAIAYRRRRGQTGLPAQLRYNMPIETLYTIVPFILVIGFFAFTAQEQSDIEKPTTNPDVTVQAYAKQWSWDFNYLNADGSANVHEDAGEHAQFKADGQLDGDDVPTLWLPVNKTVEIKLDARDVIHSFWVIDFLYKKDMIPGHENFMYFTPTKIGEYAGKCAELCGEFHSQMLFKVNVVSESDYEAHLADLKTEGNLGALDGEYDRNQNHPNNDSTEG